MIPYLVTGNDFHLAMALICGALCLFSASIMWATSIKSAKEGETWAKKGMREGMFFFLNAIAFSLFGLYVFAIYLFVLVIYCSHLLCAVVSYFWDEWRSRN